MHLLVAHWSWDPFLVVAVLTAAVHERGVRRLNHRSSEERARRRRRRAWWFYLGLAVLLVAVESPIDYWSDSYFWVHMIQHLLLIFAAPVPIVAGAPWLPLQHGVPVAVRRPVSRALARSRPAAPLRAAGRLARSPWFAVAGLNVVVVAWHLPGPFDLAERNETVHIWAMHGSFFVFGVLFWLQLIDSWPAKVRLAPPSQIAAIFATAVVFWFLAMALSLFSTGPWYSWYQTHEGPALSPFADQQLGAGIMWVCGLFWAFPAIAVSVRRLIDQRGQSGVDAAIDAFLGGRSRRAPGRVHTEMARLDAAREQPATSPAPSGGPPR